MTNKERYREFCAANDVVPIFSNPLWLDAVAENWDVSLVTEDDASTGPNIVAALPYCWKGNLLTKRIYLPDVSFYQSVLFFTDSDKSKKQKLSGELIKQLPVTVKSYFKFLPEHAAVDLSKVNYQKEDYFTYIISKKRHELFLSTNHKRNVQKGIKQQYIVLESKSLEVSFDLLTSTFARQQVKSKISLKDFSKINSLAKKYTYGKTIDCFDIHKNLLASVFIVTDSHTVYYLFGGYNAEFKNSGAMTFLLNNVILAALKQHKDFNFCGSSSKSIAVYFEGFGAQKTPITIWKKSIL